MITELLLNARPYETRLAVLEDGVVVEFHLERKLEPSLVGNIYRGQVLKILPGMEAAFVDIGFGKAGFLYVSDILPNIWDLESEFGSLNPPSERIENLLKEGQEVLVQIVREPIGTKGARLTTRITLPGHYLVLLPMLNYVGVSRRIEDEAERERLRNIVSSSKPQNMGFIVRTASEGVEAEKLLHEMEKLIALWQKILEKKRHTSLPGLVYAELDLGLRALRDFFVKETKRLIVDDPLVYKNLLAYAREFLPHLEFAIEFYQEKEPLFTKFGVDTAINQALQPRVELKSGGYIVIEETEALVTIDVNTGSFVGENGLEETIVKTNLEAVHEIVRQLRLRDLGGIIIIDFIDMQKESNRKKVLDTLAEALKKDRSRTRIIHMSELGLVEMTRKRTRESLLKCLGETCACCKGRGFTKSKRTIFYEILRELEQHTTLAKRLKLRAHPDLINHIREKETIIWQDILKSLGKEIEFISEPNFHLEQYEILEVWQD
ncbi:MAG TPA: Rne/Rng family ribonuclease [Candidatus Desulfofervidus auxilii]|uniref:Rne/Rng family ribonuclease n=1 Tax=Desulfofervidus auxilii TaxID=1621989 RepID=A0A7C0U388_DESA2|nr:Rne/Rng family ribonuclease [Candidatus Desulfofervidus auxilii]HDD44473.1 Rne/Rng family ribonuclease [Candidatus Desulfofervidus auxilii]